MRPRVIPTLLIDDGGLVKTVQFKKKTYIGDPINAVRLYNDMEVDEIMVMDISAVRKKRGPDIPFIREFASESFIPLCYGGGISSVHEMDRVFNEGVVKVALNHALLQDRTLLREGATKFGSQSVVACMDVKSDLLGRSMVYDYEKKRTLKLRPEVYAKELEQEGAGEIFVYSVDRDGMMNGYDVVLIRRVAATVGIPVIACGGASEVGDLVMAVQHGAAAAAAGSLFVYQGKKRGVLINYPTQKELGAAFREGGTAHSGGE